VLNKQQTTRFGGHFLSHSRPVSRGSRSTALRFGLILVIIFASPAITKSQIVFSRDLTQFSLEDLMNVEVTSVSKKEQEISRVGAAIFLITLENIRRFVATNIPRLLRMVPGVSVRQVDPSKWAVSIRSFNGVYANKVLVLIVGRSVYSPVSSGALCYAQDVPLEDIERIEFIRGTRGIAWVAAERAGLPDQLKSAQSSRDQETIEEQVDELLQSIS
jgi:iron complex outermembrane receptor protein